MKGAGKPGKKSAAAPASADKYAKFKASIAVKVESSTASDAEGEAEPGAGMSEQEVRRPSASTEGAGAENVRSAARVGFEGEEHQDPPSREERTSLTPAVRPTVTVVVAEGGARKSTDEGAPRRLSAPPASTAATAGEIPVPQPGEQIVLGPVSIEVKSPEDANANKAEKEAVPEPPLRFTAGGESATELAGGLQGEGGNLEKVLESYFAKDASAIQKPAERGRRPRLMYENTYRLTPPKPFSVQVVERCIQLTLNEMLGPFLYNTNEGGEMAGKIAEKIRSRVMSCRFERFKIIVLVTIGQMKRQGLHIGFRNVWDPNHDSYAIGEFKNNRVYGSAQVFGIYFD